MPTLHTLSQLGQGMAGRCPTDQPFCSIQSALPVPGSGLLGFNTEESHIDQNIGSIALKKLLAGV